MALPSTMHRFEIELSDIDKGIYDSVDLRVARHPSEGIPYLLTRVIAWLLHRDDDVEMSRAGLCDPEDPAVLARDLTGRITHWIDIGSPHPDRVHKATKAAQNVTIYTYKDVNILCSALQKAKVHRADEVSIYALDASLLDELGRTLDRTNKWVVVRNDGVLFVTAGDISQEINLDRYAIEI